MMTFVRLAAPETLHENSPQNRNGSFRMTNGKKQTLIDRHGGRLLRPEVAMFFDLRRRERRRHAVRRSAPASLPKPQSANRHVRDGRKQARLHQVRIEFTHAARILPVAVFHELAEAEPVQNMLACVTAKSRPSLAPCPRCAMPNSRRAARP